MKIKPLFDRVLLRKEKQKQTTNTGIILPGIEDKSSIAFVEAVGSGKSENGNIEMQVEVGQKVLFAKYAGSEIKYKDNDYIVVKQTDILAILQEEKQ